MSDPVASPMKYFAIVSLSFHCHSICHILVVVFAPLFFEDCTDFPDRLAKPGLLSEDLKPRVQVLPERKGAGSITSHLLAI